MPETEDRRQSAAPPVGTQRLGWRVAEVIGTVDETPRAKSLILRVPGWPGHRPGQHVDVRLTAEDGYQAQRSYSIASPPEDDQHVVLTVERIEDGEVSPYLTDELRPGDRFELRGPIGGYFVWTVATEEPLFLVAGGSGVVPLMAMLRHRARAGGRAPTRLLHSSRSHEDILFRAEMERLVETDAGGGTLRVHHTLTRRRPPGWTGYGRRIDREMLAEAGFPPADRPNVFVCGPTPLVEAAATALVEIGHDAARIRTERFGPTGG